MQAAQGGGGRGGRGGGGPAVTPGRFTAQLAQIADGKTRSIGKPQSFQVMPLPAKNY